MVKESFLEHAPRICVSSFTGENIPELKKLILENVRNTAARRTDPEMFRLPADRVFSLKGVGTVVTGTLLEGSCAVGEELRGRADGLPSAEKGPGSFHSEP